MSEQWKLIEDYPNYEVSNMGRVRNTKTGRILRLVVNEWGYLHVTLCKDGKMKRFLVHRLVATTFIQNPENKSQVNHINGIKTDNRVENLEWVTNSENQQHAIRTGLRTKSGSPKQKVRCIETGQEFESQHDAARYFGCNSGSIHVSIYKRCGVKGKYHFELA